MVTKLKPLADKLAKQVEDVRPQEGWEEDLWYEIQWFDLNYQQVNILFDMIVARWDREKKHLAAMASANIALASVSA